MKMPTTVSPQEWEAAREALLVKEKELTHARDALAAERRRMPRLAVEKKYRFEGPDGPVGLLDLFEGRRQLILYRFFFYAGAGPGAAAAAARSWPTRSPTSPTSTRATPPSPTSPARPRPTSSAGRREWAGRSPGTRSPTTSTPISTSTN